MCAEGRYGYSEGHLVVVSSFLESLREGKFHQQIREMFAPMVIRYVDLMEASITQCIRGVPLANAPSISASAALVNGSEQGGGGGSSLASAIGSVSSSLASAAVNAASNAAGGGNLIGGAGSVANAVASAASAPIPVSSDELIWKLESLQTFIRELHWTDMVFAEHLDNRLKMMAADMIYAAAERLVTARF